VPVLGHPVSESGDDRGRSETLYQNGFPRRMATPYGIAYRIINSTQILYY